MSTFDVLVVMGMKIVGNMFFNKSENKEESRTTTQRFKDEASKAFNETVSFTEELRKKAEKIQQREMVNKSIEELREIVKSNSNSVTKMAANLELKQRN